MSKSLLEFSDLGLKPMSALAWVTRDIPGQHKTAYTKKDLDEILRKLTFKDLLESAGLRVLDYEEVKDGSVTYTLALVHTPAGMFGCLMSGDQYNWLQDLDDWAAADEERRRIMSRMFWAEDQHIMLKDLTDKVGVSWPGKMHIVHRFVSIIQDFIEHKGTATIVEEDMKADEFAETRLGKLLD